MSHSLLASPAPARPLEYALAYAALGWPVLPLHTIREGVCSCGSGDCEKNAGKHPIWQLVAHGLHEASTDPERIRTWWTAMPDANIGVRTGKVSGLVAIDIDVRHAAGRFGDETWDALVAAHGKPPDTVEAITGSGGRHLLFSYPPDIEQLSNKTIGPGVDSRADGGYIVVEPGRHRSGHTYLWESSSSPLDGVQPAPLPDWILAALRTAAVAPTGPSSATGEAAAAIPLEADRVRELRSALAVIPADDRDLWLRVGMALHSTGAAQQAFGLWTEWSQTSPKYDPKDQRYTWGKLRHDGGISIASVFAIAHEYGWVPVETPALVRDDVRAFAALATASPAIVQAHRPDPTPEIPAELLEPPGVLADIARYGIESAVRPVPIFAVQAAIALGSVVCARRFMTTQRNYASLYLLNVAKSGTGKEEAKTTIERILTAAGARRLLGGSSYSSGNAVFSALLRKPQHLTIIDEFGKYLEAASSARDSFRADALTQLMEAFGRLHGDMATPQFSTMTLSNKQAADHEPRIIARPAISLLALTTPSTFYNTMSSTRVLDGFLNRFLVVEHMDPRAPMSEWRDVPVPERAIAWIQQLLAPQGNLDVGTQIEQMPDPQIVGFTERALVQSRLFEREMLQLAEDLEAHGLGDMPIRAREIALRLSLIAALADTPDTPMITVDVLDWCVSYVRFFLHQTIRSLRERVADSATERVRNTILAAIRGAGARGVTNREIHRGKAFVAISRRERVEAIESLLEAELIAWVEVPVTEKGGRPRKALVALGEEPDIAHAQPALELAG